jgi:hypothetical protein
MRVVIFGITILLFLYACSQPLVEDTDWFECDFSKDGKFLVCHERKRTETAGK